MANSDALAQVPLFEGLPRSELERLSEYLYESRFPAGSSVLIADQPGEAVYVILAGSVKVHTIRPDGAEVMLAVLGAGEVLGEMSATDSLGRSASVVDLAGDHRAVNATRRLSVRRSQRSIFRRRNPLARDLSEILWKLRQARPSPRAASHSTPHLDIPTGSDPTPQRSISPRPKTTHYCSIGSRPASAMRLSQAVGSQRCVGALLR